jgi:dihydroxyacetone kinase DhaKLM complex PTS-EIIA-like component DhaM
MTARVGIVLVSHSAALAEGTAELAGQVGGGTVAIAAAGGTDDGRLGTSIDKVSRAVERANGGAGVLIIPDLGSSVLTVRTLLDDLGAGPGADLGADLGADPGAGPGADPGADLGADPGAGPGAGPEVGLGADLGAELEAGLAGGGGQPSPGPVAVADAPFVEGAVAAAVTAAAGADLKSVLGAAQEARHARKL